MRTKILIIASVVTGILLIIAILRLAHENQELEVSISNLRHAQDDSKTTKVCSCLPYCHR